jgi:putative hydrolase of the HAD superfamily
MTSRRKYLIWDFDGTLGYRPGQWSGALVQVLRRFAGLEVDIETLRPFMRKGFPWHRPDRANPALRDADDWWKALVPIFQEAFVACGLSPEDANSLAGKVRSVYTDVGEWRLYEDTSDVLSELRREGWRHAILSNHVPELPSLIAGLGLDSLIGHISNSAETGFEKPHPRAFQSMLEALEAPGEVWMIGDNIQADVLGAESVGLRAILVRSEDPRALRRAAHLQDVRKFLG